MIISFLHFSAKQIYFYIFFDLISKFIELPLKSHFFVFIRYKVVAFYSQYRELFFVIIGYDSFHFTPSMIAEVQRSGKVVVVFPSPQRPYF
uniref:Uncharacterized protein n=1 Tax=Bartonella schoenbuchensis (strain DSM 13525 / NCTC 13165 / R1) TaxID=687861 RepID=E6YXE4_BARSR|nr:hypothetical protein B11C_10006 [Bartonella schoenbuchensis R1]